MKFNAPQELVLLGVTFFLFGTSGTSMAECYGSWNLWSNTGLIEPVVSGILEWDEDGAGPVPPSLFLATTDYGANEVSHVYVWHAQEWQLVGSGPSGNHAGRLYSMVVYDGELYICTNANISGQVFGSLKRWNGTTWDTVGSGNGRFMAGLVFRDELIVGGDFTLINSLVQSKIASWNGSQWNSLGAGLPLNFGDQVQELAEFNDELIVWHYQYTPPFPSCVLLRWDGVAWRGSIGDMSGCSGYSSMEVVDQKLYVGGATGQGSIFLPGEANLAAWNGTEWVSNGGFPTGYITDMAIHNGKLVAGGEMGLRIWDGIQWQAEPGPNMTTLGNYAASLLAGGTIWNYLVEWVAPVPGSGDGNGDAVVDEDDAGPFLGALTGPLPDPSPLVDCRYDMDLDGDLDLFDFAQFQMLYQGG